MAIYKCLADLQGKTLKLDDIVYLKGIQYSVQIGYLKEEHYDNERIFNALSISSKESFASKAYGYKSQGGAWPECNCGDYEALTRLVIELYKVIESSNIGFKIDGSYIRQLGWKEAVKLFKGYSVRFDESKWGFDSIGWYYWNTQDFQLHFNFNSNDLESKYQDITPSDNPNQWYKITTPGKTGISPEEVKNLILKYGGILNSNYSYNSELGVYLWKKNKCVECLTKKDAEAEHAIEVSPTTEITTIKKEEKHENQFQRKKARIERGTKPKGNSVCGRRGKASIAVGHLSYRKVTGI